MGHVLDYSGDYSQTEAPGAPGLADDYTDL